MAELQPPAADLPATPVDTGSVAVLEQRVHDNLAGEAFVMSGVDTDGNVIIDV